MTTKDLVQGELPPQSDSAQFGPSRADEGMNESQPSLLDRSLFTVMQLNWETIAWILLLIVASALRFVDVGTRAMSHDESLHSLYSYYLYDNGNYEHNPMMHGTLLFHMNAIAYFLFGDNDTTARIVPVLFGIAVVWMMWLFRRYIGRMGALVAAVLITISPSLLFHSRYIRNDIYIALFILIWIYGAFRYLETRNPRWLMVVAMGMAWGFIAKENHFMNGAIMGGFFVGLALWGVLRHKLWSAVAAVSIGGGFWYWLHIRARELANQANGSEEILAQSTRSETIGQIGLGICIIIAAVLVVLSMKRADWTKLRWSPSGDLAILMATLVLPFVSPFLLSIVFRWDLKEKFDNINGWTTGDMVLTSILVGLLALISMAIAYIWFQMRPKPDVDTKTASSADPTAEEPHFGFFGWLQIMGAFWLIQIVFFTTFLTNIRNGLATGIVGSLGYWLAQQEVARGGQPWYYYLMLGALYEFLPWILTGIGIVAILYWHVHKKEWDPVPDADLPVSVQQEVIYHGKVNKSLANRRRQIRAYFAAFGVWWVIATWLAYTVAGEKMPWLMTHMALTMCVVGGWWFGRMLVRIDWVQIREKHALWLIGITPALILSSLALAGATSSIDRSLSAMAGNTQRILALVIIIGLLYALWRWGELVGWWTTARLLGIGFVSLLLLLTVRFSYMLTFINYDMATEYLVYAHASPDVKRALAEIDSISERTVGGRNITIAYDDESSWPMSWYMRQYPNHKFYGSAPNSDNMSAPVIIVGPDNYDKVHPYVMRDYVKRTYRLVWWPDMTYFNMTWDRLWNNVILDPQNRESVLQIAFYRRYSDATSPNGYRDLAQWPQRHEFEMWVRRDLTSQIWDLGVAPVVQMGTNVNDIALDKELTLSALATYGDLYDGVSLMNPREIAVGVDGMRVIADSGNHRIVMIDQDGNFVRAFGSLCRLAEGESGGCVDPDGNGPLEMGDGQLNEPWGVTVDQAGRIYVSDTWNGRIQVFDREGKFIEKWGVYNTTNGELGDAYALFGPRGIVVDVEGNVLVADTGNKRIIKYTPDGQVLQQVGGGGVVGGRFEEPVGLAVSPVDGTVYVADTWNRRIQKLSSSMEFIEEWQVAGWESQDIFNKPYLDVAPNGDLYVADPQFYRIVVHSPTGEIKASFGTFGNSPENFDLPTGVAIDPNSGIVLVTDANNNRIQSFSPVQ